MPTHLYLFLAFSLFFVTLPGFAEEKEADPSSSLSEAQVLARLTASERFEWQTAKRAKTQGQSRIESGEWLASRTASPFDKASDIEQRKAEAEERIKQGEEMMAEAEEQLKELRRVAYLRYEDQNVGEESVEVKKVQVAAAAPVKALNMTVEKVMQGLWSKGYNTIIPASANYWERGEFKGDERLSQLLAKIMNDVDGNRFTVELISEPNFVLKQSGSSIIMDYAQSEDLSANQDVALVVVEVVPRILSGYAVMSVRGIDPQTLKVVSMSNATVPFQAPAANASEEGSTEAAIEKSEELKVVTETPLEEMSAPDIAAVIEFEDKLQFFKRLEETGRTYHFRIKEEPSLAANQARLASIAAKNLILNAGHDVSDVDFVLAVFEKGSDGIDATLSRADAAWIHREAPSGAEASGADRAFGVSAQNLTVADASKIRLGVLIVAPVEIEQPAS